MKKRQEGRESSVLEEKEELRRFLREYRTPFPKMECAYCHGSLKRRHIHNSLQPDYYLWKCKRKAEGTALVCPRSKAIHEDAVGRAFVTCLNDLLVRRPQLIMTVLRKAEDQIAGIDARAMQERNRKTLEQQRNICLRLEALYRDGLISSEEYVARYQEAIRKQEELQKESVKLAQSAEIRTQLLERIRQFRGAPEEDPGLREFDPVLFGLLVKKCILGADDDPFRLIFIIPGDDEEAELLGEYMIPYRHHIVRGSIEGCGRKQILDEMHVSVFLSSPI